MSTEQILQEEDFAFGQEMYRIFGAALTLAGNPGTGAVFQLSSHNGKHLNSITYGFVGDRAGLHRAHAEEAATQLAETDLVSTAHQHLRTEQRLYCGVRGARRILSISSDGGESIGEAQLLVLAVATGELTQEDAAAIAEKSGSLGRFLSLQNLMSKMK